MTRARLRRIVLTLVVIDLLVVAAAAAAWVLLTGGDERANAVNAGLRGSRPPEGQLPDLSSVAMTPAFPDPGTLEGTVVAIAATCRACRSGDVLGGFLGRLQRGDVPAGAQLHVVAWSGAEMGRPSMTSDTWGERWRIGARQRVIVHDVRSAGGAAAVQRRLGIGDGVTHPSSGVVYAYDEHGRWRSSWFLGQLDRGDLRHDLRELAR